MGRAGRVPGDLSPGTIPSTSWEAPKGKPALPESHSGQHVSSSSAVGWFLCCGVSCRQRSPRLISPPSTDCKTCSRDFRPHPWQQLPPPASPGSWEQTGGQSLCLPEPVPSQGQEDGKEAADLPPPGERVWDVEPGQSTSPDIPNRQRYLGPDCYPHGLRAGGAADTEAHGLHSHVFLVEQSEPQRF